MKKTQRQFVLSALALAAAIFVIFAFVLRAQETATPVQGGTTATEDMTGLSDLEVELRAIEMTPPAPAAEAPQVGTFWSAQHAPGSAIEWPPLPANVNSAPVWDMGDGVFLLSDLGYNYNTSPQRRALILGGGMRTMDSGDLTPPDDGGDSGTNVYTPNDFIKPDYGTNLYIAQSGSSIGNLTSIITNSQADILYEIQSTTNLAEWTWTSEGFVYGSELTNWTAMAIAQANRPILFLRIRSWVDSNHSGIPDWWWLTYFGQATNVDANASAAGDAYSNLQKFQLGLNPTNYYNPNPLGGFFGAVARTNACIYWDSTTNVVNYRIQRGILDPNTGLYGYTQFLADSNATWFEDVGAITNDNAQNNTYTVTAIYAGGSSSGTNGWVVSWFADYASYGPPYGPPLPGSVYAYADATGTNVLVSWKPTSNAVTNYIVLRGVFTNYSYAYQQVAQVPTNTLSVQVPGILTNLNNWGDDYSVKAVYPGGGLSYGASSYISYPLNVTVNVGSDNVSNSPTGFYGFPDSTGTNIFLTWNLSAGATNYIVYGGFYDYDVAVNVHVQLATVGAMTNWFTVKGAIDGDGNNLYAFYNVVAVYPGGALSSNAVWYAANGAPAPGAVSAYLDATGTNVMISWSPVPAATGYLIQKSDYYGESWTYYQIAQVGSSVTSYEDVDGLASGYDGANSIVYSVQAMFPDNGLSPAVLAEVSATPPAPTALSATVDSTGTNVSLAWSPAVGAVTSYTVQRGTYNPSTGDYSYSTIGTVGAGTTTFLDIGGITGNNSYNNIYKVVANYAGGSVSQAVASSVAQSSTSPLSNLNVTAQMVRNQTGRWQLMFSSIPANVQKIAFYWYLCDYFGDFNSFPDTYDFTSHGQPFTLENDIPVSRITNGIYVLPDFLMTNWFPNNALGKVAMIQPIGTNNEYGVLSQAGFQPYDSPVFVDGRQHLKQNLLFKLRGATINRPVDLTEGNVWFEPLWISLDIPADTNYVESSFFHLSFQNKENWVWYPYMKMDNIWPFTANYQLHGNLYDPSFSGPSFSWQSNATADFPTSMEFRGTLATVPATAVLGISDPYWILQLIVGYGIDPSTGLPYASWNTSTLADLAAYTNSGSLFLQNGAHNLFGLAFQTALVNQSPVTTLATGGSVALTNANVFFSQTVDPSLLLTNYYFAPVNTPGTAMLDIYPAQLYPLPSDTGFANTNQTGVMITSVGTPTVIGGWARFSILNGSASKFAYLGQYYVTNAFVMTNGIVTTNTTGVVSPYGDFFPTEPGAAALITMPDINTGQQGTGVVRVISLNVDANHDGTLDFQYNSPDFVSSSKPFRFWVNDDKAWSDDMGDGIPGQGAQADGVLQVQIPVTEPYYLYPPYGFEVHGRRDLVDFFPVNLNIVSLFQSNAISAGISVSDTNYQFVLSQADGALRFAYTDLTPTNYLDFLRDIVTSSNLAYAPLTTISQTANGGAILPQPFVDGIATNNQSIILVEAWTNTTQPLVLTIYHGSNQIAQTSLHLSITGVEQMFRHKNLLLNTPPAKADRLTDVDVPNEPDTTDMNFIFVHGYNVSPNQARGWDADFYKRLYWSGSHAKFYAVTWEASDSQILNTVTINLQTNIVNAFLTASNLASFIGTLRGETVAAAHSLGNMTVLSALNDCTNINFDISKFFMIDAAVPIEAIQGNAIPDVNMIYPDWRPYTNRLYASDWWQLFPINDARSMLTWNNRLANFGSTTVYNFYSSGEEVLREYTNGVPPSELVGSGAQVAFFLENEFLNIGKPTGCYTWAWQEMLKGRGSVDFLLSSSHGGWKFNLGIYYYITNSMIELMPPDQAALVPSSQLKTNAFFDVTSLSFISTDTALFGTSGSTYAQANRNRILSDSIPALTLPVGANPVSIITPPGQADRNFDMQTLKNNWPISRKIDQGNWHHSDCRQVAYTFTHNLFDDIVTFGGLQ